MTYFAKIGSTKIQVEPEIGRDVDLLRESLKATYPEVKNATVRTKTEGDHTVIEFLAQPGKKG